MRGCSNRTARASRTSRVRTRIISPRTPRNPASCGARGKAAAVDETPASGPSASPSTPNRRRRRRRRDSASAASPRADRHGPRRRKTAPCGSARQDPAPAPRCAPHPRAHDRACARRSARFRRCRAAARRPACHSRDARGTRASHQSIAHCPSSTTSAGALSPSQHGASMPPAQPRRVAAKLRDRSTSATSAPRSASFSAVVSPDDAGADHGRAHRLTPPPARRARRPARRIPATCPPCRPSPRPPCAGPG